jgi:TolB-like protein/Tfp pilus assembly protein PilF
LPNGITHAVTLFAELKRRNVFKVGAAYLVVAWLLIQVAATIAPQLNLPEWAPRLITLLLMIGFPVALLLAWFLERAPEGLRVEPATTGTRAVVAIAAVLAALAVGWYVRGRPAPDAGMAAARSIAVLPFVNMSGDAENEYFSDGVSEEILNVLARTPDLRVAARTSSFAFKGQAKEIPDIARELEVRMVLEGSVRKQADRVRITAQLIDAEKGFHLWSQTYDRELKDIFAIQDEIARAIARELEVTLGDATAGAAAPAATADLEAYDLYLRGRELWHARGESALRRAIEAFEQAIARDPAFAEAHAGLGAAYVVLPFHSAAPRAQAHALARDAAEHALALDPGLADAYAVLGDVAIHALRPGLADALLSRALAISPSHASARYWLGEQRLFAGDLAAAERELTAARAIDPLGRPIANLLTIAQLGLGKLDTANAPCRRILELAPTYESCRESLLIVALAQDDLPTVRALLAGTAARVGPEAAALAAEVSTALEQDTDSRAVAERLAATPFHGVYAAEGAAIAGDAAIPFLLLRLGHADLALNRVLDNARREPTDFVPFLQLAQLDVLRCRPEFVALVAELGLTDPRAARTCASGTA